MSDTSTPQDPRAFNEGVIAEFRANGGEVGGFFADKFVVLLTTTGAKSGNRHTTPLVAGRDGNAVFVIASAGGSHRHPAWYHNLVANPSVTVEVGSETYETTAQVTDEPQRTELYTALEEKMSFFTDYRTDNPRTIPVVRFELT